MIAYDGTWGDVRAGHYVKDSNGKTWRVDGDLLEIEMTDKDGKKGRVMRPPTDKPVTILVPTRAEAVATVELTLDGTEVQ